MKKHFVILGSIGFVAGLIMYFYGVILIAEYYEYRSTLPPCEYDREVSCIPPMQYFQYMPLFGIPITLVSATMIAFGFIKSKYYYGYIPAISILLIAAFFGILFSRGS